MICEAEAPTRSSSVKTWPVVYVPPGPVPAGTTVAAAAPCRFTPEAARRASVLKAGVPPVGAAIAYAGVNALPLLLAMISVRSSAVATKVPTVLMALASAAAMSLVVSPATTR